MEISTNNYTITLTSTIASGYEYIHTVQKVSTTETTFENSEITDSTSTYNLTSDGYYILSEIKLPNVETVDNYYILDDVIYDPDGAEITAEELLEVDTTDTNITREDNDYFLYYYLETYYINLIKDKFMKGICSCNCVSSNDLTKTTIDTLTMGLDVVKILLEYLQYYEAQRMIEQLSVCSGEINVNCNCYD